MIDAYLALMQWWYSNILLFAGAAGWCVGIAWHAKEVVRLRAARRRAAAEIDLKGHLSAILTSAATAGIPVIASDRISAIAKAAVSLERDIDENAASHGRPSLSAFLVVAEWSCGCGNAAIQSCSAEVTTRLRNGIEQALARLDADITALEQQPTSEATN